MRSRSSSPNMDSNPATPSRTNLRRNRRISNYGRKIAVVQAEQRLAEILSRAGKIGVPIGIVTRLEASKKLLAAKNRRRATSYNARHAILAVLAGVLSVTMVLVYYLGLHTHSGFSRAWLKWQQQDLYEQMCTIPMPDQLTKLFRPPEDCSMCKGIDKVEKVAKITPSQFEKKYAYTGRPVVVTDAMENWTAQHVFSFQFFKNVYEQSLENWNLHLGCQFFPYETEFTHLKEVFNMSEDRAHMKDGTKPWYIGWSNCDDRVARILRQHYDRPYFLPQTAENKKVDWIFMGSPGYGAHMHLGNLDLFPGDMCGICDEHSNIWRLFIQVDNVEHPSWQAQLKGRKKWTLEPPPECYYQCNRLEVVVEPGEIIVLDTNRWYHQTLIVSDEMSITIGAEYD